jgi:hypothetical protein
LNSCKSIADLSPVVKLIRLNTLDLYDCRSIVDLTPLSNLTNVSKIDLSYCKSIKDLTPLANLKKLVKITLFECKNLTSIAGLARCLNLEEILINDCPYIRDALALQELPGLREFDCDDPVLQARVLMGSAVRREDVEYIRDHLETWLEQVSLVSPPEDCVVQVLRCCALLPDAEERAQWLEELVHALLRSSSEPASPQARCDLWKQFAALAFTCGESDGVERCFAAALGGIAPGRDLEERLAPLLLALADVPIVFPGLYQWAWAQVEEILRPLQEHEGHARRIAPAAALFYAGFKRPDKVEEWLERGTRRQAAGWKDEILQALVGFYAERKEFGQARHYLSKLELEESRDRCHVLLAEAMAASLPKEAMKCFEQVREETLRYALATQLIQEPAVRAEKEDMFVLLLSLGQDPQQLAEFIRGLLAQHPEEELVAHIARWFSPMASSAPSPAALLYLLDSYPGLENAMGAEEYGSFKRALEQEAQSERSELEKALYARLEASGDIAPRKLNTLFNLPQ